MMKKFNEEIPRVLDTSALVHDPKGLLTYHGDVYICLTVLEELDNLKERRDRSISADARVVIRMLEDIINGHTADEMMAGIPLPFNGEASQGRLFVGIDTELEIAESLAHGIGSDADNRIINYALHLQKQLNQQVVIVSRDINMRLKARTRGLKPNGTKTYYKDFLPMSMGALNAITMKIKMQYYKRSYWNILFRTKMKDARKNLIR